MLRAWHAAVLAVAAACWYETAVLGRAAPALAWAVAGAAVVAQSSRKVLASGQASVAGLPVALATNLVAKMALFALGFAHMALSKDTKYAKRSHAAMPAATEGGVVKRVVFIRHGESAWNEIFNKGFGPSFPVRLLKGLVNESLELLSRDSVLVDTPLNGTGRKQALDLATFVEGHRAGAMGSSPTKDAAVSVLAGAPGCPPSALCSSNLRRAAATVVVGCRQRLAGAGGAGGTVEVLSSLQEISRNVDTLSLSPAGAVPVLMHVDAEARRSESEQHALFSASENAGNKRLGTNGGARLDAFAAWAAARPEQYVVAGGHSLFFKQFFARFLPEGTAHAAASCKIANGGVVAFDLCCTPDRQAFRIPEESVEPVYGGFEKPKGGKGKKKRSPLAALAACCALALAMRVALGPHPGGPALMAPYEAQARAAAAAAGIVLP